MGEFDFTYILPENFEKRVVQYLLQLANRQLAEAFQHCKYEYEDVGLAYYAGLIGDNWNKRALDFSFEGAAKDISVLKRADKKLKDAIGKALKPSESGFLIRNVVYFDVDVSLEDVASPSSNEERLNCDIQTAKNVLNDLVQIGERVCWNALFNAESSENSINDYFRDMFFAKGYLEVKDQSRHGVSASGKDAAEVDILLTKDGKEIGIFEGMKLNSINADYIDRHSEVKEFVNKRDRCAHNSGFIQYDQEAVGKYFDDVLKNIEKIALANAENIQSTFKSSIMRYINSPAFQTTSMGDFIQRELADKKYSYRDICAFLTLDIPDLPLSKKIAYLFAMIYFQEKCKQDNFQEYIGEDCDYVQQLSNLLSELSTEEQEQVRIQVGYEVEFLEGQGFDLNEISNTLPAENE